MNQPVPYTEEPTRFVEARGTQIADFTGDASLSDQQVIDAFGAEWLRFGDFDPQTIEQMGREYFDVLGPELLGPDKRVLDAGCGSGRFTHYLCDKVGFIEAADPSDAVLVAARLNQEKTNVRITRAGIESIPFADQSFDLVMCIGVLHHMPSTEAGMAALAAKVRPGGHLFAYLYYNFENRSRAFRLLFWLASGVRWVVSRLPRGLRHFVCELLAIFFYMPFVSLARLVKWLFPKRKYHERIPLSYYADKRYFVIRNDALDRFGTRLEKRYSRADLTKMALACGLEAPQFSPNEPYWHFVARKPKP